MIFTAIKGYENLYEVSDTGVVRSLDRILIGNNGAKYTRKGRVLSVSPNTQTEYLQVSLWKYNAETKKYLHRLIAEHFIPNPQSLPEINHKDGNRQNNLIGNLEWVTSSGNSLHAVKTGLRVYTNRLTKAEFVECLWDVIEGQSYTELSERVPYKVPYLSTKLRSIAKELGVEGELDASILKQRQERARVNGVKSNG